LSPLSPDEIADLYRRKIEFPEDEIPGLPVRFSLLVWFAIIALEGLIAVLDRDYGGSQPVSYLYVLPVLVGGMYLGYPGGLGVPLLSVSLFGIVHTFILRIAFSKADILWLLILLLLGMVTARIQIDRRLARRQARQLERLRRAQEELTALIVHDLRTPLAGVLNVLRIIAEENPASHSASHQQLLDLALATGEEMNGMISDLLALHTMESAALPLQLEEVRAEELMQSALQQITPIARQRDVETVMVAADDLPALRGDVVILRRVLVNLLGNALRVSPRKSTITVEAQRAEGGLLFSVTDQGPGIPADLQQIIFEKFASIDFEAGKHVSTGLGLAFAKMAVQAHGGRIWVQSPCPTNADSRAPGSCFLFTLPLNPPQ